MSSARAHLVFVYGSLRRGQRHHRLLGGSRLLGLHRTAPGYTMIDLGAYPGVVDDGQTAVTGEVYRVSGACLRVLDWFEGCPAHYRRTAIATPWGAAWIYLLGRTVRRPARRVAGGDWCRRRG
jgi:gamma-glutamylcyclotransferase (GGCT)/AIG2-like uncharacterized protein YtfP